MDSDLIMLDRALGELEARPLPRARAASQVWLRVDLRLRQRQLGRGLLAHDIIWIASLCLLLGALAYLSGNLT